MKHNLTLKHIIIAIVALSAICACKTKNQEPQQVPSIIKAYTEGVVTDGIPVRIEFASLIENAEPGAKADAALFSFTPSLKGSAVWTSCDAVEFVPEAYEPSTTYQVTFNVGKLTGRSNDKFTFSIYCSPKEAVIYPLTASIKENSSTMASFNAKVVFSENLTEEQAGQMISISVKGERISSTIKQENGNTFIITSDLVERKDRIVKAEVAVYGKEYGYKTKVVETVEIPALGEFKVLSAELVNGADPYIEVKFSHPLSSATDYNGLIQAYNFGRYNISIEDNVAKIYVETLNYPDAKIVISEYLKDISGRRLDDRFSLTFESNEIAPAIELPFKGNILPDASALVLPFRAVNLSAVDVTVIKIFSNNVMTFLQENQLNEHNSLRRVGRKIYKKTVRLDVSKDLHQWQDFSIDLSHLIKQDKGAIYRIRLSFKQDYSLYNKPFSVNSSASMVHVNYDELTAAEVAEWDNPDPYYYESTYDWYNYNWRERDDPTKPSYYMVDNRFKSVNLLYSNIGLIAKYNDNESIYVNVNDMMTAKPLQKAEVTIYNYQLQKIGGGTTDKDGSAIIRLKGKPFIVVASSDNSTGYLKVTDGTENSMSRFDTGGERVQSGIKGFAYGDRGVWRPGDTLYLSLMVHDMANRLPKEHPVKLEIFTPGGQYYSSQINFKGTGGIYSFAVPTRQDDPTGIWNAYFKIGGTTFHKSLNIETIKPNRLKIDFKLGDKMIQASRPVNLTVNSSWLSGAQASNLAVSVDMTLRKGNSAFAGYKGYTFNDPTSDFTSIEENVLSSTLDNGGSLSTTFTGKHTKGTPGMLSATFVTRVSEPGGDQSFISTTVPYSPYSAYVGIKSPKTDGALETDTDHTIKVAVLSPDGKPVKGHNIEYRVYQLKWRWWWESNNTDLYSYVNGTSATPVAQGKFTSDTENSFSFNIKYPDWGRYLVYVKDLNSGHASGEILYIDYPLWRGRADRSDPDGITMLTFSTDKKKYEVGETATLYVPAAQNGMALVSLENSRGIISQSWVETSAQETPFNIAVTADMAPNFYVHITLLQPHGNTANDLPLRMYGVQPVEVYNKASVLEPVITMDDVLRPQQEFKVKVNEKNGKPMSYTLAVVDEGLLDITGFRTPSPWNYMYAREALGVKTWDMYDMVVGAFGGKLSPLFSIGGDMDVVQSGKKDNRFNPVVKFIGPFSLKAKGTNEHKISLPMYVGSVRVMLVAGENGAYGNAEKTVPVRSPLMILPTAPRVLGTNEKVAVPVNVFAMEDNVKDATVSINVEGPAKVEGDAVKNLHFAEISDKLAAFTVKTSDIEGSIVIRIKAVSGSYTAEDKVTLEVRNPEPVVTTTQVRTIKAGQSASFDYKSFRTGNEEWARLTIAGFPTLDINNCFNFMSAYSYNCTEQIASRGITLLSIYDMADKEQQEKIKTMIPSLIQTLCGRQLADGGFTYWPGSPHSGEWISSMAGQFLKAAATAGYQVNPSVLNSWVNYQQRCIKNYRSGGNSSFVQAYRLYTLALYGKPDNAAMNRLREEPALSVQARWTLAAAYCLAGKKATALDLVADVAPDYTNSYSSVTFGSPDRDKAIYLETMVLMGNLGDAVELADDIARGFSYEYMSTQTTAFSAAALSRLAKAIGTGTVKTTVREGDASRKVESAKAWAVQELDSSTGSVTVTNNATDGVITAVLTTRCKSEAGQGIAKADGLNMTVSYTDAEGNTLNPSAIRQGTDIYATVRITNTGIKTYGHLALSIAAPSGWELWNERLTGNDDGFDNTDIRDDKAIFYFGLAPGKSRVITQRFHASYCGSFVLPAVHCEDMYEPQINARTASSIANVLAE